ncbi:RNA-directed DNA polymerase, eukaryota, reverse transcriptase zinc-binding domain protein [Tanacetum coccineum]|uniref:RNA-directed DNA polymerase, eukaryota, reverse transcriptase zinc-binding domain protein n=1 Tax=Tanacetum coccineum TaxID=301880 RepID=A0ABQ5IUR4_9ASTR
MKLVKFFNVANQKSLKVKVKPLMVQKWDPSIGLNKTEPTKIPVWVKLSDLPMEAWTTKGISGVSSSIGRPLIMDSMTAYVCKNDDGITEYTRVLVEIEASKGFKEKIELQYRDKNMSVKGSKTVKVTYDWKPPVCSHCLVFGHDHKECKVRARTVKEIATEKVNVDKQVEDKKEDKFTQNNERRFVGNIRINRLGKTNYNRTNYMPGEGYRRFTGPIRVKMWSKKVNNEEGNNASKNKGQGTEKDGSVKANKSQDSKKVNNEEGNNASKNKGQGTEKDGSVKANKSQDVSSRNKDPQTSNNSFCILRDLDDGNIQGMNMLKDKIIVDKYLNIKMQPSLSVTKNWSKEMKNYFQRSWEAGREKERNKRLDDMEGFVEDIEDAYEDEGIVAKSLVAGELKGWNRDEVNVLVVHSTRQMVLCLIENIQNHEKLYCSFIYAANSGMERRSLWNELQLAKCITNGVPWVIMRDFNVTLKLEEHSAGSFVTSSDMQEFIDCVNLIKIEDVCMTGLYYTWIKSPSNPSTSILKKLDRIMANEDFMKKKPFKFANFVADKKEFKDLVVNHWIEDVEGFYMFKVSKKLKMLKKHIKKLQWKNRDKEIVVATLEEFNEALNDEEKFISQKAKVDWLSEGDRNSAYFHKVVKGRRNRNRILNIINDVGESVEGPKIANEFVKHYEKFLGQATPVHHLDSLGNIFTNILSNDEAEVMVRDVTDH